MVGDTNIHRPSREILNSGLKFDHFEAPFRLTTPSERPVDGFISVADALDWAIIAFRRNGRPHTVTDSTGDMVYTVE